MSRALSSTLLITDSPAEIVGRVFESRIRGMAVGKVHLAKYCWQNWGRDAVGVIEWNVFAGRALGASSDNICPPVQGARCYLYFYLYLYLPPVQGARQETK